MTVTDEGNPLCDTCKTRHNAGSRGECMDQVLEENGELRAALDNILTSRIYNLRAELSLLETTAKDALRRAD